MRTCATANAVLLGFAISIATFAACSGGPPTQPPAASADKQAPLSTAAPDLPLATGAPALPPTPPGPKRAETVADCKEILTEITNDPPDGGVVLNNAMTAADAGASDRLRLLTDLVRSKRDGFRCCFDLWSRKNPGVAGHAVMTVALKADGSVTGVEFEKPEPPAEVGTCVADLARALTYPKSPSGKETRFTYPFDFKPHR